MDSDTAVLVTLWVTVGVFVGGVVTPLIVERKRVNEWLATFAGVVLGGVGGVFLLVPLWLLLRLRPDRASGGPAWQRDAISLDEALAAASSGGPAAGALAALRANFWPRARNKGHSHRLTFLGVFVALAALTLVEVLLTVVDVPFAVTGPLVGLSTGKVMLVVLYFMHLRYDSRWYAAVFASAVPFAVLASVILALS
ncbi:MAG: cytochrome C oxidase subunit IV family protein [Anaerolineae bacterium]|nr:cytochrome C oxidase subunit IV family protein [Anaerolineae bacterium]